jgi:hypothetical protein
MLPPQGGTLMTIMELGAIGELRQYQHGILPEASWRPLLVTLANVLEDSEIVADLWKSNGVYLAEDFQRAVDKIRPTLRKGEFYRLPDALKPEGA